ncbi:MAG: ATP-binding protein [Nitrospinaceae bacterium]
MSESSGEPNHPLDEKILFEKQLAKYAKEFSNLYHSEKEKRIQLEEAHKKLSRYAAELEETNEELRDFAFIASHDLQEPLRKILLFSDRIQDCAGQLDARQRNYYDRLQKAVERMRQCLEALLDFSRVTRTSLKVALTNLTDVTAEVREDLEDLLRRTGGQIETQNLPALETDRIQIRQLFQNLLSNGLKFHQRDDTPLVKVCGRKVNADLWEITFRDNGLGFDEKYLNRIFKPFERLHKSEEIPGKGMGLTICHKIVERLGGTLSAASRVGEGSIFTVTLPEKFPGKKM